MKRLRRWTLFATVCWGLGISGAWARKPATEILKIGLVEEATSLELSATSEWQALEPTSGAVTHFSAGKKITIEIPRKAEKPSHERQKVWTYPCIFRAEDPFSMVLLNNKPYRGELRVEKTSAGFLRVVNLVDVEDYVSGILPKEMSADWPLEALKAQAVASRTFALGHIGRHIKDGFDLCAKTHCQVYGGAQGESENSNRAVGETAGEVLVYHKQLIQAMFFACCGGRTEDAANVWKTNAVPYLHSVKCKPCKSRPGWKIAFSEEALLAAARRAGYEFTAPLKRVRLGEDNSAGRPGFIDITHAKGRQQIPSAKFRMAIGPDKLKSTAIDSIKKSGDEYIFEGRGWGHGVGLCQEGARAMALAGSTYPEILQLYYSPAELKN